MLEKYSIESFENRLLQCLDFADIFELVKEAVETVAGKSRAGLTLGIADLGGSRRQFLGAFYPFPSNMIVINSFPIKRLQETRKELLKPYIFTVLLHEYIHTLGCLDEAETRQRAHKVCLKVFGASHLSTELARDITRFLPEFSYPNVGWFPQKQPEIKLVGGFDKGNVTYVA